MNFIVVGNDTLMIRLRSLISSKYVCKKPVYRLITYVIRNVRSVRSNEIFVFLVIQETR